MAEQSNKKNMSYLEENHNVGKISFSSLLLSDIHLFCSFMLSHPFYFAYILFFSPYIFKILSFLSPLFITTTLLLLALLTTSLHESLETHPSFLFSFCIKLFSVLEPKFDFNNSFEAYKMVLESCSMECSNENFLEPVVMSTVELTFVDKFCSHESTVSEAFTHEEFVDIQPVKFEDPMDLEREESDKCEKEEEKVKVKPRINESKAQKVDVVGESNEESYDEIPKKREFLGEEKKNEEEEEDVHLKSFGSMRKEKEWRRTLACKLFEERHNADVGQGMDQLWETYETQIEKKHPEEEDKKKQKKSMMKTKSIEKQVIVVNEEDDEVVDHQQLCCLQALKFSTGKMHMGIAKPKLLKLSKAFKSFGRFYNATKHFKKASRGDE